MRRFSNFTRKYNASNASSVVKQMGAQQSAQGQVEVGETTEYYRYRK